MLQNKQLVRFIFLIAAVASFGWSSNTGGPRFVAIYDPLTIKAQKSSPAYVIFEELFEVKKIHQDWKFVNQKKPILVTSSLRPSLQFSRQFEKKIVLDEMVIQKSPESIRVTEFSRIQNLKDQELEDHQWIESLPEREQVRVREAQIRNNVLDQDWNQAAESSDRPKSENTTRQEIQNGKESFGQSISGPIEITGGLAITNEHHIEVRRSSEGVQHELGRVDLSQGTYNIVIGEPSGTIIARLVNKEGKTLGEGSFRLNQVAAQVGNSLRGPRLRVRPQPDFSGVANNFYNTKPSEVVPVETRATFIKGINDVKIKNDGVVNMENVTKGSSTVLRIAAPKYLQTAQIIVSGQEFKTFIYPELMIKALKEIVSEQRAMTYAEDPNVIWGKVALDGKPISGVQVSLESDPDLEPVYFNQFLLPDPNLKGTSENGFYAFVNVRPGFQSLVGSRSNTIFGYANVMVEEGSVAQGDIDSTIKFEPVPIKIFDAFSGEAHSAEISMQSIQDDFLVEGGSKSINLPQVSRIGMMQIRSIGNDYISARYLYNDSDEFIHIPLIQYNWLRSIKASLKIDDTPNGGIIVGFMAEEDFEVFIAGNDDFNQRNIVYFDVQGRVLQNRKGLGGGGFILYNVPEDTHEVVVIGSKTQKIYSRVLPVDPNSLSVLTFH
jgi:hypothetical protein